MDIPGQTDTSEELVKLSFFTEIGKAITASRSLGELLHVVMEKIGAIYNPANWSILMRNHRTGDLTFVVVTGEGAGNLRGKVLPRGTGIAGWIAENGQPVIIENVAYDKRFDGTMDGLSGFTTKSIIGIPLKTRTRVFGVIELINRLDGHEFTTFDLRLLETIGDYTAIAIEKLYYIQALRRSATIDHLTKLYNRRLLMPFIRRELESQRRTGAPFALLFLDIDNFKTVNDRFGHDTGDTVLCRLADIFRSVVRKADFLCRWGGDEFVIVLTGQGRAPAMVVRDRLWAHPDLKTLQDEYGIGLSIGIREGSSGNPEDLLAAVDRDMYEEKMARLENDPEDMPTALEEALEDEANFHH